MVKYSVSDVWNTLRPVESSILWCDLVWKDPHIPRHSFLSWLVIKDRVTTRDKLKKWGLCTVIDCLLCSNGEERCRSVASL
ncbi:hypothetical protein LINPERHAP1_LOCUS23861 [Linum perenne]